MSHHRHTGRVLPRQHTAYPALAMIVLCVGVLIGGLSHIANAESGADSFAVNASLPGPPPATPATITSPVQGKHFRAAPITVSGTCPLETYIELIRNGLTGGVALCDGSGRYSIRTDLFSGTNVLQAQAYSQTNLPGPVSAPITVFYDDPVIVRLGPLIIKSSFRYTSHYIGDAASYQLSIEGGRGPYAINVDWGDGSQQIISIPSSGAFSLSHSYQKASVYHGSFPIIITAVDALGNKTSLELLAIVSSRPAQPSGISGFGSTSGDSGLSLHNLLNYIWPTYGVTVLMLASFWLGERQEVKILRHKPGRTRHV